MALPTRIATPSPAAPAEPAADVLVVARTPLLRGSVSGLFPAHLTLRDALDAFRQSAPDDDADRRRTLTQIDREMSAAVCHFLVGTPAGGIVQMPPETILRDVARPLELRTPKGLRTVPAVTINVQAYAQVGLRRAGR